MLGKLQLPSATPILRITGAKMPDEFARFESVFSVHEQLEHKITAKPCQTLESLEAFLQKAGMKST